jgi:hypothetical protein
MTTEYSGEQKFRNKIIFDLIIIILSLILILSGRYFSYDFINEIGLILLFIGVFLFFLNLVSFILTRYINYLIKKVFGRGLYELIFDNPVLLYVITIIILIILLGLSSYSYLVIGSLSLTLIFVILLILILYLIWRLNNLIRDYKR